MGMTGKLRKQMPFGAFSLRFVFSRELTLRDFYFPCFKPAKTNVNEGKNYSALVNFVKSLESYFSFPLLPVTNNKLPPR